MARKKWHVIKIDHRDSDGVYQKMPASIILRYQPVVHLPQFREVKIYLWRADTLGISGLYFELLSESGDVYSVDTRVFEGGFTSEYTIEPRSKKPEQVNGVLNHLTGIVADHIPDIVKSGRSEYYFDTLKNVLDQRS